MNLKGQLELYKKFKEVGQSLWLDSINRDMILNGYLANLIEKYEISGLTSNPTIFENAILGSNAYDESLKIAAKKFSRVEDMAYSLMIEDIQRACDLLKSVYEKTSANDGYVSIEIPPTIDDTNSMIDCASKIWEMVARDNLMIKIPATESGIKAEEELLKKGINVNMTLIFSPSVYSKVVDAYISAIKWRIENNITDKVFSVASFFVSRIDTEVSKILSKIASLTNNMDEKNEMLMLNGKAALSVSLIVYEIYLNKFYLSGEFKKYSDIGIKPQKLLWASTSTKDPSLKDTIYIDELCLPATINTAPQQTLYAFFDHGRINTEDINSRILQAKEIYSKIESLGVSWEEVYDNLLSDGIKRFIDSYKKILSAIESKLKNNLKAEITMQVYNISIKEKLNEVRKNRFIERLFLKDATLWRKDEQSSKQIKNSLGWTTLPTYMKDKINEIIKFRDEVIEDGFRYVILLGMGGSSLASEVIVNIFGHHKKIKLFVLDSTNPEWILRILSEVDIKKTLFIVSSKSGTTLETISHFKYFYSLLKKKVKQPGKNFIAITDEGTPLKQIAIKNKFRKVFINPSDIGGRFSALSYFGLVPAVFTQADISKLISKAQDTMKELESENSTALILGCFMGNSYLINRDKLTIIVPKKLERFGLWIEQLIAESTGKEGKGLIPIINTEIYDTSTYSDDRSFIIVTLKNFEGNDEKIKKLIEAKHPVLRLYLNDIYDIAKEFYKWEIATAVCGHIMKINPFDQPDVQFTKDFTKKLLKSKNIPIKPDIKNKKWEIYLANMTREDEKSILWQILKNIPENGYLALCGYIDENPKNSTTFEKIKRLAIENGGITFISVYGPRYLHSIGQLFKGGKNTGIFIILTSHSKKDIKILGEDLSFRKICISQAQGDFLAMKEKGRKCIMVYEKQPSSFLRYMTKELESLTLNTNKMEDTNMPKAAVKSSKKQNKAQNDAYVVIDYPKHQETITSSYYTIRIGTSPTNKVEVSIDGGPWMSARESVGYWWFDWYNITPGTHEIIARIQTGENTYITSKRRRCKAVL